MKTLFVLPNRRKPFTASQYIQHCQAKRDRIACARIDFREACFRTGLIFTALVLLSIVAGGLIQSLLLFSR